MVIWNRMKYNEKKNLEHIENFLSLFCNNKSWINQQVNLIKTSYLCVCVNWTLNWHLVWNARWHFVCLCMFFFLIFFGWCVDEQREFCTHLLNGFFFVCCDQLNRQPTNSDDPVAHWGCEWWWWWWKKKK